MPWIGYFDMIRTVDLFVFFDDVQLTRRSWQVRNKLKTAQGELLVSVPVEKSSHRDDLRITDAMIQQNNWRDKLIKTLHTNYKKAANYDETIGCIEELINFDCTNLSEFNINIIETIARKLGIKTPFLKSSTLCGMSGSKDERLVDICKAVDAQTCLSALGSAAYIEEKQPGGLFPENYIELVYQQYTPAPYPQLFPPFIPYLSIFDVIINVGFVDAVDVMIAGHQEDLPYLKYRERYILKG